MEHRTKRPEEKAQQVAPTPLKKNAPVFSHADAFSRTIQIEYAMEAVKQGSAVVGLKVRDGDDERE